MKFIRYVLGIIIVTFIMFQSVVFGIICFPKGKFNTYYNSLIQEKFKILKNTNVPKIIIVSGSTSAFGLDQKMLEDSSGYKVANLGLHAGFGHLFPSELAKANINKGDIVLLGYEYGWQEDMGFISSGADLIMMGIDDNIEMYKYLPTSIWKNCLGYLFDFAKLKNTVIPASGIYSREAFDPKTGQMTMARDYEMEYDKEVYGTVDLSNVYLSQNSIDYLKNFKKYIEKKGASVYFIAPPLLDESVISDPKEFTKLKELEEKEVGIKYISDPVKYLYPKKWMSNAIYHCNSIGEEKRTEMLIEDMKNVGIIK